MQHTISPLAQQFFNNANISTIVVIDIRPSAGHSSYVIVQNAIDTLLTKVDFTKSFDEKIVILYDETLISTALILLHDCIRKQTGDISNVIIATTHTAGATAWYNEYCRIMHHRPAKILELLWEYSAYFTVMHNMYMSASVNPIATDNAYYFDYYGGTNSDEERDAIAIILSLNSTIQLNYHAGYTTSRELLLQYIEEKTDYIDARLCDSAMQAYPQSTLQKNILPIQFGFSKIQTALERTVNATPIRIVRETANDEPYTIFTEKTLEPLLLGQILLPLGYNNVEKLEQLGIKFMHDVVDYSYQTKRSLFGRISALQIELDRLVKKYTRDELIAILQSHIDIINHNSKHVSSGKLFSLITTNAQNQLNG